MRWENERVWWSERFDQNTDLAKWMAEAGVWSTGDEVIKEQNAQAIACLLHFSVATDSGSC